MGNKDRLAKISEIKEHLVRAKKLADKIDLPKLAYRGIDASKLEIDDRLIDILKYIGNGCPNIYYKDDWGIRVLPEYQLEIAAQLNDLINAMEMAGIQEDIDVIAPEVAAKLRG
ncbi:MAG: hypothetical protein KAR44_03055 [Candidatus Aegiribacteria sp.]|nr:hypothetical protein [Candidatus Aegiribacteria sp.]